MSRCHTRGSIFGARKRPSFLTFLFIFARFGRFGRFGIFGGFVSVVSVVSLVSVVSVVSFRSFRWFRFGRFVSLFRVLVHAFITLFPNNVFLLFLHFEASLQKFLKGKLTRTSSSFA